MQIVVLTTSYPTSSDDAAGHFVKADVARLLETGHHVTVIAPLPSDTPAARSEASVADGNAPPVFRGRGQPSTAKERVLWLPAGDLFGAPGALERLRQAPLRARHLLAFALKLNRVLNAMTYDKLIAHWLIPSAFPVCFVGWPRKRKGRRLSEIVVHGSDARLLARAPRSLARHLLAHWVQEGVRFRCVSVELQNLLADLYPPILGRSCVAASAITVPRLPDKHQLRTELALGAEEQVLICVGRLIASKRMAVALNVARQSTLNGKKTRRLLVLGEGPLSEALRQSFPEVEFLGQRPRADALRYMAAADVLVSASKLEGAPTVIREARALGTEVWTCPAGDVEAWAKADPGIRVLSELA